MLGPDLTPKEHVAALIEHYSLTREPMTTDQLRNLPDPPSELLREHSDAIVAGKNTKRALEKIGDWYMDLWYHKQRSLDAPMDPVPTRGIPT